MLMSLWRLLRYLLLLLFLIVAVGIIALRYYVLPNIDNYRPQITAYIGQHLGLTIELSYLRADWQGINPQIEFSNLVVRDAENKHELLRLPKLNAGLSWRSLLEAQPIFRYLYTQGLQLDVRRDKQGDWWLLNQALSSADNTADSSLEPALLWLARQRNILITDSSLHWTDDYTQSPALLLQQVHLELHKKAQEHTLVIRAVPPSDIAQEIVLRANVQQSSSAVQDTPVKLEDYQGRMYLELRNLDLLALAPWLSMPVELRSGRLGVHASLDFAQASWGVLRAEALLQEARWRDEERDGVSAASLGIYTVAPWQDYLALLEDDAQDFSIPVQVHAQQVYLRMQKLFSDELNLQDLLWHGAVRHDANVGWQVQAQQLRLKNDDIQADLQGEWHELAPGSSGHLQLKGPVSDLSLVKLVNYLPLTVESDARSWMRDSLLKGRVSEAYLELDGAIDDFPYGQRLGGEFTIAGTLNDVVIDYLPATKEQKGWPRIEVDTGKVTLHNARLSLQAEQARMPLAAQKALQLSQLQADIPNLEVDTVLQLRGHSQAPAASYTALLTQTPLGGLLGNIFDQAQAQGSWSMPLELTVPLTHSEDTQVAGALQFAGGEIRLMPEAPWLRDLQGELQFTEQGVSAEQLQARLLGGEVSIQGRMEPGQSGLQLKGKLLAERLGVYVDSQALRRLEGELSYESTLKLDKQAHFGMDFVSDLVGLQSDFPEPLRKSAQDAMPLSATWYADADGANSWLDIRLQSEPVTTVRLQRRSGDDKASFFRAMLVLAGQTAPFPEMGAVVDGVYKYLDLDAWDTVLDEFVLPWEQATPSLVEVKEGRTLLPPMSRSRVQVEQARFLGVALDKLTLTNQESSDGQFRLDISSAQTAGTLWGQFIRRIPVGQWKMQFNRLSLGHKEVGSDEPATPQRNKQVDVSENMTLPDIEVNVDKLTLYGYQVGRLSMVGRARNGGQQWQLEKLQLDGEGLQLQGDGDWQLRGSERGLRLRTQASIESLGSYLNQLGLAGVLSGGRGHAKLEVFWPNFPWSLDRSSAEGHLTMDLQNGRFSQVGSRSARILELISLQSLSRLFTFSSNPAGLFKDGFPFDEWIGSIDIEAGQLRARDYSVAGPVGVIKLEGHMQLDTEALDFTASVYPKLDVSGAAVAAGVIVNPFIGLGTLIAQWLLQDPLAQGMAIRYHLGGTLDKPEVKDLDEVLKPQNETVYPAFIEP